MTNRKHTPRPPAPADDDAFDPAEPPRIDPYACIAEGREPTPEEVHAFVHAHDTPLIPEIDPMHGRYEDLPREENGRIHPYYLCTKEEILGFGLHEPPRRHRSSEWTPGHMADFIDALGTTASVAGACAYVGKSRMSAYRLRNRADAGHFRAAWDEALRSATAVLADTAYQRAVEGVREDVWHNGEVVGQRTRYNDRLLMFLLRVRDPHGYAPVDELDRASRHRALPAGNGLEAALDRVEAAETLWAHAITAPERGDAPAIEMLTPLATLAPLALPICPPDAAPETDAPALIRVTSVTDKGPDPDGSDTPATAPL